MQELEKIFKEIDTYSLEFVMIGGKSDAYISSKWVKDIIRKYMNGGERFEFDFSNVKSFDCQCGRHFVNTGIEEIQQYREIGTVEECREAVEKQKPKPCEFYGDEEDGKLLCPNCGEDLWDLKECGFNACPYCGQAVTL